MTCEVNISDLLKARAHIGHLKSFRHPSMEPYIYGSLGKLTIINLDKTKCMLEQSMSFLKSLSKDSKILFIGSKNVAQDAVKSSAERISAFYVNKKYFGGLFTNFQSIQSAIKRLKELENIVQKEQYQDMTKKEILVLKRRLRKLNRNLGGIKNMNGLPDCVIVVDVGYERIAVKEVRQLGIPLIGLVDTNHPIEHIQYPIAVNDDSRFSIKLCLEYLCQAVEESKL